MLKHCVFLKISPETPTQKKHQVLDDLSGFSRSLAGVLDFDWGENLDFEQKSRGFTDGFVITFRDQKANDTYANHPTHKALGAQLVDMCEGGADGIMVFDLSI